MINLGVSQSQITAKGKSDSEAIVPNTSDENRAKNRRVELIME